MLLPLVNYVFPLNVLKWSAQSIISLDPAAFGAWISQDLVRKANKDQTGIPQHMHGDTTVGWEVVPINVAYTAKQLKLVLFSIHIACVCSQHLALRFHPHPWCSVLILRWRVYFVLIPAQVAYEWDYSQATPQAPAYKVWMKKHLAQVLAFHRSSAA